MPVKLGLIGCGNIGRAHARAVTTIGQDLVAVCDIRAGAMSELAKAHNVARTYATHEELVADKDVEAVIVGTPNHMHAEHAIAALEAGKHVLLEKPMAMNVGECDRIIAAAKRARRHVQIGMVNRFGGAAQALKHFIDAGRAGRIYSGQTYWYRRRGIPGFGTWFTVKSQAGGGALIDIGVHMLDLALYLMDFPTPVAVSGQTYNNWTSIDNYTYTSMWGTPLPGGKKDVDDYALATIRFDGGATLQLNVSWALNVEPMEAEQGLRLMGDKGGVALKGMGTPIVFTEEAGHVFDAYPQYAKVDGMAEEDRHFCAVVRGEHPPMPTAEQGRVVQSILDAIYRSSAEGREVRLE